MKYSLLLLGLSCPSAKPKLSARNNTFSHPKHGVVMLQNVWKVFFFRRNVQPEAADAVAVVLQRLLAPLAQGNQQTLQEVFSKPNDAAVWLKTIATTLEALTVHLPHSSQQMSGSACRKSPVSTVVSM